jgi:hypothetical protein
VRTTPKSGQELDLVQRLSRIWNVLSSRPPSGSQVHALAELALFVVRKLTRESSAIVKGLEYTMWVVV